MNECLTCNHSPLNLKYDLGDYRIVECSGCGVMFNETFFDDPTFSKGMFEKKYYDSIQSKAFENRLDKYKSDPSAVPYNNFLKLVEMRNEPGRVLDVGCAFGSFLKIAQDRGWEPFGVEISKFSSDNASKKWGFQIFNGQLRDAPFKDGYFDLITFWDSIEHVRTPREDLQKAFHLLKPGGHLLVTTDNYFSLVAFIAQAAYRLSLGKMRYPVKKFFIPYNSVYFKPENFKFLIEELGFRIVEFRKIDYPIEKLDVSGVERLLVKGLYTLGEWTGLNSQFLLIAQKGMYN